MAKARSSILAALDIGSSKIACFIGIRDSSNKLRIIGIGHQIAQGIKSGLITDMQLAENSILGAISAAEQMSGQTIDRAIVNISGNSIESHNMHVETNISGHEVTDSDINHVINHAFQSYSSTEKEIIHCIPTDYSIDKTSGIKNPKGMYGSVLSTNLHVVTASSTYLKNLVNCLAVCRLNIDDCVISSYASGIACLTEDEKNLGAMVIDIGGGCTSVAIFVGGSIIYTESFPVGGLHITKDLARGLSTSVSYAERIKTIYGSCISSRADREEIIDVPLMSDTIPAGTQLDIEPSFNDDVEINQISKVEIVDIIQPRVEEIFEIVKTSIEAKGLDKIAVGRIILTGGTSQLAGIKDLATSIFNKQVRVGRPFQLDGLAESTKGPAFSTAIGLMQFALSKGGQVITPLALEKKLKPKSSFSRLMRWFDDNL